MVHMGVRLINIMQQGIGGTVGLALMTTRLERHITYRTSMLVTALCVAVMPCGLFLRRQPAA